MSRASEIYRCERDLIPAVVKAEEAGSMTTGDALQIRRIIDSHVLMLKALDEMDRNLLKTVLSTRSFEFDPGKLGWP